MDISTLNENITLYMSQSEKKERIAIAETEAVYVDEDGETRLKTAQLNKSGG